MLRKLLTILSLIGLLLSVGLSALVHLAAFDMSTGVVWQLIPNGASLFWRMGVPFWISALFFAAVSWYLYAPLYRRRKRCKLGLCLNCGYNLKGLREPRCPECGEEFETT